MYLNTCTEAENSLFHVEVDTTNDIIVCVLKSYVADDSSCIIQAVFELQQDICSNHSFEIPNYVLEISSNVSIAHLPRDQVFCFIAEAKNSTSTMTLMGTFSTLSGCT